MIDLFEYRMILHDGSIITSETKPTHGVTNAWRYQCMAFCRDKTDEWRFVETKH